VGAFCASTGVAASTSSSSLGKLSITSLGANDAFQDRVLEKEGMPE